MTTRRPVISIIHFGLLPRGDQGLGRRPTGACPGPGCDGVMTGEIIRCELAEYDTTTALSVAPGDEQDVSSGCRPTVTPGDR